MKVYVLTLDGYVQGVFRSLAVLHRTCDPSLEPTGILGNLEERPRAWSRWNLQQAFRTTKTGYVSLVTAGDVLYEVTRKELVK